MEKRKINIGKFILKNKQDKVADRGLFNGYIALYYAKVLDLIINEKKVAYEETKNRNLSEIELDFVKDYQKKIALREIFIKFSNGINLTEVEMEQMVDFMLNYSLESLMRINIDSTKLKEADAEIALAYTDVTEAWNLVKSSQSKDKMSLIDYYKLYCIKRYVLSPYKSKLKKGNVVKIK